MFRATPLLLLAACGGTILVDDQDQDGFGPVDDCDDLDPTAFPGAPERCNGRDDDCDGDIDEDPADAVAWYVDRDGDGYGAGEPVRACEPVTDRVSNDRDCDDTRSDVAPGQAEQCDDVDHDCDGDLTAGGEDLRPLFYDQDRDGFVGTQTGEIACLAPPGQGLQVEDCDDRDATVFPGALERCDDIDQDCDGGLGFEWVVRSNVDTLQQALERSEDGDRICLPAGYHPAAAILGRRRVALVGAGSEQTFLLASDDRMFDLYASDLSLTGMTLTGGRDVSGSIVRVANGTLALTDVAIHDVQADSETRLDGVVLAALESDVTLRDVEISGVQAHAAVNLGGGLIRHEGGTFDARGLVLADLDLSSSRMEGALYLGQTRATVHDLDVRNINLEGGGLLQSVNGTLDLQHWRLQRATVDRSNGAALYAESTTLTVSDGTLYDIELTGGGAVLYTMGAGTTTEMSRLDLRNTHRSTWAPLFYLVGETVLENVILAGNTREGTELTDPYYQGAMTWWPSDPGATLTLRQVTALGNDTPPKGGLLSVMGGSAEISNVSLDADMRLPIQVRSSDGAVWAHDIHTSGSGALITGYPDDSRVDRLLQNVDPGFFDVSDLDATRWNLHLRADSPLRDAGDPEVKDADGSPSDIGAYGGPMGGDW